MGCDEIRELAPEIALGVLEGEQRADALRHLAACTDCRREVEQLSHVADELLMLAPVQEPPAGFESRVVEAIGLRAQPRRRRARRPTVRWLATRLGPALAAAAVTAGVLVSIYHDDHLTAERYRDTLAHADGQYFQAEPLRDGAGARSGVAFGYQGSPSWLLVTVDAARRDEVEGGELVTKDGRTVPLPAFELGRDGTWGGAIPVRLYRVGSVRLLGAGGTELLEASFPAGVSETD
jgi:hypothetical protein